MGDHDMVAVRLNSDSSHGKRRGVDRDNCDGNWRSTLGEHCVGISYFLGEANGRRQLVIADYNRNGDESARHIFLARVETLYRDLGVFPEWFSVRRGRGGFFVCMG